MSEQVRLFPMEFKKLPSGDVSYGYCLYYGNEEAFDFYWEKPITEPAALLRRVHNEGGSTVRDLLHTARYDRGGIYIDDDFHDWESYPALADLLDRLLDGSEEESEDDEEDG